MGVHEGNGPVPHQKISIIILMIVLIQKLNNVGCMAYTCIILCMDKPDLIQLYQMNICKNSQNFYFLVIIL